jgi:hypothetical protein
VPSESASAPASTEDSGLAAAGTELPPGM